MNNRYSEVKKLKHRSFRYDFEHAVLEFIYTNDEGKIEVLDGYGLSRDEWNENADYWIERYYEIIEEEVASMLENEY